MKKFLLILFIGIVSQFSFSHEFGMWEVDTGEKVETEVEGSDPDTCQKLVSITSYTQFHHFCETTMKTTYRENGDAQTIDLPPGCLSVGVSINKYGYARKFVPYQNYDCWIRFVNNSPIVRPGSGKRKGDVTL